MTSVNLCFYCDRSGICPFYAKILKALEELRGYDQNAKATVEVCSMFVTTSPNYPPKESSER